MYTKLRSSGILLMMSTKTQKRVRENSVSNNVWECTLPESL